MHAPGHTPDRIHRVASVRRANPGDLVAGIGTLLTGGRWIRASFRRGVCAGDAVTALDEVRRQNLAMGVPTWMALPLVVTAVEVEFGPILHLTDGRIAGCFASHGADARRALVGSSGPGRRSPDPGDRPACPRQGFTGLLAPSAPRRNGANAVVFPDRLGAPSAVDRQSRSLAIRTHVIRHAKLQVMLPCGSVRARRILLVGTLHPGRMKWRRSSRSKR